MTNVTKDSLPACKCHRPCPR